MWKLAVALDYVVVLFSTVLALAVPLIDAQVLLPEAFYPMPLVQLKRWYVEEYGDYLSKEKPYFFIGLVWVEIVLLWPLSLANVYGILTRRSWAAATSIMAGVSVATSMAAVMAELLGSGRASEKLLQLYTPFIAFSVVAILRGLLAGPCHAPIRPPHAPSSKKKRA
ncbi:hypothetical protein HPP92_009895 [Vanilla planifolia]|uniref:EXPERA domain-containing protein n=1 Tax=Vanilla planifolia TaxID=51239 RepID=A0A835V3J6_VANPL|nr:hypothetical protein HPP92_010103 [Vanilla planifolia]KAG0481811.1 hypothetical protein HPP92_009895 [Vanilla planifolia]